MLGLIFKQQINTPLVKIEKPKIHNESTRCLIYKKQSDTLEIKCWVFKPDDKLFSAEISSFLIIENRKW